MPRRPCIPAGNNDLMAHRQAHIGQRGGRAHEPAALLQPTQRRQPAAAAVLGGLGARWQALHVFGSRTAQLVCSPTVGEIGAVFMSSCCAMAQ